MSVKFQDYYAALGVPRDASPETIKLGFRKLARLHHPDVARDKVAGEARFKEINEAYEILGDPEKRRHYDELAAETAREAADASSGPGAFGGFARRAANRSSPGETGFEFGGAGFSDFYEAFFGGAQPGPRGGADVEAELSVTFEEALQGSRRRITLRRPDAAGAETYAVRIPAGVHEGQRIRLAGRGSPGADGAAPGDILLRVRLSRHPDFVAEGADLLHELDIAPWEAALGARIKIPALGGAAWVRVPAGANEGLRLRLRGLGLPINASTRGDLFATVRLRTPPEMTAEERGLWENLGRIATFRPRGDQGDTTTR